MDAKTPSDYQSSYDRVADEYVRQIFDELQHKPFDRELLDRFAASVRDAGLACDMGCGPGHVARYLHEHGVYSATPSPERFDGLELRSFGWHVEPLAIKRVHSSFFSDEEIFPQGSVRFDCALLMRGIEHEWHAREPLCQCESDAA
jgi:hypothetical protein